MIIYEVCTIVYLRVTTSLNKKADDNKKAILFPM